MGHRPGRGPHPRGSNGGQQGPLRGGVHGPAGLLLLRLGRGQDLGLLDRGEVATWPDLLCAGHPQVLGSVFPPLPGAHSPLLLLLRAALLGEGQGQLWTGRWGWRAGRRETETERETGERPVLGGSCACVCDGPSFLPLLPCAEY